MGRKVSNKSGKRGRRELVKRGKLLAESGSLIHRAGVKNYFFFSFVYKRYFDGVSFEERSSFSREGRENVEIGSISS